MENEAVLINKYESIEKCINRINEEYDNKIFDKYIPHLTSNNISKDDNVGGRPSVDNPTNENTIQSQSNGGNNLPSPSDKT